MGRPLPVRGIAEHLVWGEDGAAWACYEVEPFGYPHRSARDAREVHTRTAAALLGLPAHSLILSVAYAVSAGELETRLRGRTDPGSAPGWSAVAASRPPSRLPASARAALVPRPPTRRPRWRTSVGGSAPCRGIGGRIRLRSPITGTGAATYGGDTGAEPVIG
jgi:hypothetical protein